MQRYAVIVAGGKGERMGAEIPKQFLLLAGKPLLMHTLLRFHQADASIKIILVLPETHEGVWQLLCKTHQFDVPHVVVHGGAERFYSVQNGLRIIADTDAVVAVHDGVRPLTQEALICKAYAQAEKEGSAIVVVKMKDSVRELVGAKSRMADRSKLVQVQTPQVFTLATLRTAYAATYADTYTDDASVVEASGKEVQLLEGDYSNIKITTAEDLIFAEALLSMAKKS